ncbi:hypothetical protein Tco_0929693 [Tanacetum coccineum]
MASNEETNAAGTDTRPPMLVEKWALHLTPMITDPPPTESAMLSCTAVEHLILNSMKSEKNKLEMADTQLKSS